MADDASARKNVDWTVLGLFALVIGVVTWIPIPIVDRLVENQVRRRMMRATAVQRGVELDDETLRVLADRPAPGCFGCLLAIVLWPIVKLLKWVLTFLQLKEMADVGSDAVHRTLLLEEAIQNGWIPGEPTQVRAAMDKAIERIELRPVERLARGTFRAETDPEWAARVAAAVKQDKDRVVGGGTPDDPSPALDAMLSSPALVPELLYAFRAEMGKAPHLSAKVPGLIEAAEVLPPDGLVETKREEPPVTDAEEVRQLPARQGGDVRDPEDGPTG